ncbi:hypothetical protein [Pelagicoccus albus]|uniref:Uncharacterized protein n=1 Tax=Pelagicoccus albus TaxID=415222 RepID=A0A7X1B981_9BACT|nr:hypothetical protein [Pelagicoccus albus]MBC2607674.1 hypothetical protein [Pelagicoccus albus]
MILLPLAELPNSHPGDAITDVLGVVAVCSFLGIACYIGLQVLKDSHRKVSAGANSLEDFGADAEAEREAAKPKVVVNEREELERHCREIEIDILETGRTKLSDFALIAENTFDKVADGYASNSFGHEGETHAVRSKKFLSVCERQWGALRSDIGYVSYMDIQDHLRHILINHRMLNGSNHATSETLDMSPDVLRSQELVALVRVVPKEKVKLVQEQLLKAIAAFRNAYEEECKAWLNEQIVKVGGEMRPKKSRKVQVPDTEYYNKFKQLKIRLEVVARLADSVTEKTERVSEAGLALSQVIHVGTILRILATLPEWFTELELTQRH